MPVFVSFVALVVAAGLVWHGLNVHRVFRETLTKQFQDLQSEIAKSSAQGIESVVARLTSDMLSLAATPRIQDVDSPQTLELLIDFYRSNQEIAYAGYRMNSEGVLTHMYPIDEKSLYADIRYQEHVVSLFETRRLVISGLFRAVEGFDAIAIHAPVFKGREMNGSVATIIKLDSITNRFLKGVEIGAGGYAWLVDEDGMIIFHPEKSHIGKSLKDDHPAFDEETCDALSREIWRGRAKTMQIGYTLFSIHPFSIGDRVWTVVISTPYAAISGPISDHWRKMIMLTVAVLLLMYSIGYAALKYSMKASQLQRDKAALEERVGLEKELKMSHDRLDHIIKMLPSGLFTVDTDRIIQKWNNTAERLTGYMAEEVVGQRCSFVMSGACGDFCSLFKPSPRKGPIVGKECEIVTKTGRKILVSKNADLLRDADGNVIGGIESFIDITEAKRAEESRIQNIEMKKQIEYLEKMNEGKTNFLSMVSHELRTPLSVMLGNLDMAQKERYGMLPEKFAEKLKVVLKRGWQLNDLIDNLILRARIEMGAMGLAKRELNLDMAAREALEKFRDEIDAKKLRASVEISKDAEWVFADESMFQKLLSNLISNAVKFTPDGCFVKVASKRSGKYVKVTVKDNGIGIPPTEHSRIFERFYQIDDTSTRQYGGTGLGLDMVKQIASIHDAEIRLESAPGSGTEISVVFADKDDDENNMPTEAASSGTILLFDASPDILTAVTEMPETEAHNVIVATSIDEASDLLARGGVRLVLFGPKTSGIGADAAVMAYSRAAGPLPPALIATDDPVFAGEMRSRLKCRSLTVASQAEPSSLEKAINSLLA
jgi:PAS domain S-box-containing protein